MIVGRTVTIRGFVFFFARIEHAKLHGNGDHELTRSLAMMSLIGSPGTGKTTMLANLPQMLLQYLSEHKDDALQVIKAAIHRVEGGAAASPDETYSRLLSSLQPGSMLVCWVRLQNSKELLPVEIDRPSRMLALRLLYGTVTYLDAETSSDSPLSSYHAFVEQLQNCPGLLNALQPHHAISFLQQQAEVSAETPHAVLVLWDECNCVNRDISGRLRKEHGATWVQQAAADIIQLSATTEDSCLLTMIQGTSRGSDSSMAVTSTHRAKTGILPLAAATLQEEQTLMLSIYQKLCRNVEIPVPEVLPAAYFGQLLNHLRDDQRRNLLEGPIPIADRLHTIFLHLSDNGCHQGATTTQLPEVKRQLELQVAAHVLLGVPVDLRAYVPETQILWGSLVADGLVHPIFASAASALLGLERRARLTELGSPNPYVQVLMASPRSPNQPEAAISTHSDGEAEQELPAATATRPLEVASAPLPQPFADALSPTPSQPVAPSRSAFNTPPTQVGSAQGDSTEAMKGSGLPVQVPPLPQLLPPAYPEGGQPLAAAMATMPIQLVSDPLSRTLAESPPPPSLNPAMPTDDEIATPAQQVGLANSQIPKEIDSPGPPMEVPTMHGPLPLARPCNDPMLAPVTLQMAPILLTSLWPSVNMPSAPQGELCYLENAYRKEEVDVQALLLPAYLRVHVLKESEIMLTELLRSCWVPTQLAILRLRLPADTPLLRNIARTDKQWSEPMVPALMAALRTAVESNTGQENELVTSARAAHLSTAAFAAVNCGNWGADSLLLLQTLTAVFILFLIQSKWKQSAASPQTQTLQFAMAEARSDMRRHGLSFPKCEQTVPDLEDAHTWQQAAAAPAKRRRTRSSTASPAASAGKRSPGAFRGSIDDLEDAVRTARPSTLASWEHQLAIYGRHRGTKSPPAIAVDDAHQQEMQLHPVYMFVTDKRFTEAHKAQYRVLALAGHPVCSNMILIDQAQAQEFYGYSLATQKCLSRSMSA
ncbi:hypothetical protein WJX74_006073 [Apatococcus lobatus]|uniref:Uncharacterized protein n=1 Tax=Apatococcus lobatus TaxID=904363 RepID=A0AAW1RH97_9CHLO